MIIALRSYSSSQYRIKSLASQVVSYVPHLSSPTLHIYILQEAEFASRLPCFINLSSNQALFHLLWLSNAQIFVQIQLIIQNFSV